MRKQKDIPWIESLKNYFKYRSTKRWFSIVLIFAFFTLLVPREWIHDCGHAKSSIASHQTHVEDGACFLCDFQLASFTVFRFTTFHFLTSSNACRSWIVHENEALDPYQQYTLRGPPELI